MNWTLIVIVALLAGVGAMALRFEGRRLEAKIGEVHLVVEDVNKAVNHKPADQPTLYEHARQVNEVVSELSNRLTDFTDYQHKRNGELLTQVMANVGRVEALSTKLEDYVAQDAEAHDELRDRLHRIERNLAGEAVPQVEA